MEGVWRYDNGDLMLYNNIQSDEVSDKDFLYMKSDKDWDGVAGNQYYHSICEKEAGDEFSHFY